MTIFTLSIPRNEADFEDLVLQFAEDKLKPAAAQAYGRRGTGQHGIDHQLRLGDESWLGIQCKRYWDTSLTTKLLQTDLTSAHAIKPALQRYIVATTKRRSKKLQDWARNATINGKRAVDIWFWDDIESWLNADPARLSRYEPRPAIVHAEGLLQQVGGTRTAQEVVFYAATPATSASNDSDPESVKAASILLQAGHPQQAFQKLTTDREALSPLASVWRVSAAALYTMGDHPALLALAQQASTLGIADARLTAIEAAALFALGDPVKARSLLLQALASASAGQERGAVLNHWLNFRLEADQATYESLLGELKPGDHADPRLHLALAQAALFEAKHSAFVQHLAVIQTAKEKVGEWASLMLTAMAAILDAQLVGLREGIPLPETHAARQRVQQSIAELDLALQHFVQTPHAQNRVHALMWRARGATLVGNLDLADASYRDAVDAAAGRDTTPIQQATHYAAQHGRKELWEELLRHPSAGQDPLLAIARAAKRVLDGDATARAEMRSAEDALAPTDPRRAEAIAARLFLPFDASDTLEAIERALLELKTAQTPADPLVVGLALQLTVEQLDEGVRRRIRDALNAVDGASLHVSTHLKTAGILMDAEEYTLCHALQPARDAAIDAVGDLLPRDAAVEAARLTLQETRLNRARTLLARHFPDASDTSREAWRLRSFLALKSGDLSGANDHLAQLVARKIATALDVKEWAWNARALGKGLQARHQLKRDAFPPAETERQVASLAHALKLLFRHRDYDCLVAEAGDRLTDDEALFPVAAASMLSGHSAPPPEVVAVDTIAVLRREGDGAEQAMIWITDRPGPHSPPFTRVQRNESWLEPLIGQGVGSSVTIDAGGFAGTWTIEQILHGAVGTHKRLMDWAARQGMAAGGVDTVKVDDDPVGAITRRLQEDKARRKPPPDNVPLAMIARMRECLPFRFLPYLERPRCFFGRGDEIETELQLVRHAGDAPVYVDPLTILVAEQLEIADVLIKAAGRVRVMAQSQLTLAGWWWEERQHRHARASTALGPDGSMVFQEHTPAARAWGLNLWRRMLRRRQDPRIEILSTYTDAAGQAFSALADSIDVGTLATLAAAAGSSSLYASIDGNLNEIVRSPGPTHVRAISIPGLLRWGVIKGRITSLECARAIAKLARANWSFISVGSNELSAVLMSNDRQRRHSDLKALLRDFKTSEPRGAVRVVVDALDAMSSLPSESRPRRLAENLFDSLPVLPRAARRVVTSSLKGRWYYSAAKAWAKKARDQ